MIKLSECSLDSKVIKMVGKERMKPVLVGLSGGLDSLVAAYLLRIQKRELYAVIIAASPEIMQDEGDQIFACHQSDARIATVKKICEHLQIPLTIVRPRDEFVAEVMEPWMSARIEGRRPRKCHDCHGFRMHWLVKKMKELGCGSLATGHYAKIVHTTPGAPVAVHSSNDLGADQASLLAALPQEILSHLELPLSELQRKEVTKIADNFELHPSLRPMLFGSCLPSIPKVNAWIEQRVPEILRREGEVLTLDGETVVGKHTGFHTVEYGSIWPAPGKEVLLIVSTGWREKELKLAPVGYFKDRAIFLRDCVWGEGIDFTAPIKGFIHHAGGLSDCEVLVSPRTLGAAWIQLVEGEHEFPLGEMLTIFKRRGKNAKVVVTGVMLRLARHWGSNKISIEAKAQDGRETVELDKDFNF
jgi:tRNA U34 2-thiouridine synthase MnmA/TrmU